jgi:hypothetical protein
MILRMPLASVEIHATALAEVVSNVPARLISAKLVYEN